MIRYTILTMLLAGLMFGCRNKGGSTVLQDSILGSWEVKKIKWITADTTFVITKAQPGYLMVLQKQYAFMWTPTEHPRVAFKKLAKPTDKETLSGFRSIVFNSGTYQISDSTFNIKASIAKVPGFEGGTQSFKYNINNDSLILRMVDETYPNGDKPDWYGKVETEFTLSRIN